MKDFIQGRNGWQLYVKTTCEVYAMAMSGFICHDDYYDRLKRLSNEEVGHLFRQLMLYHAGRFDEMTDFIDSEGIAFDFIANDIERMEDKHITTIETNKINGSKGGRPKKQTKPEETEQNRTKPTETETNRQKPNKTEQNRTKPTETETNRQKPNKTEQNRTKPYKDKDKDNKKENNKEKADEISDDELTEIILKDQAIENAALNVGLQVTPSAMQKARDLESKYGHDELLKAINASVDVPKWSYVEGILRNGGVSERPKPKAVPSQGYEQRDYKEVQDELELKQAARILERLKGAG